MMGDSMVLVLLPSIMSLVRLRLYFSICLLFTGTWACNPKAGGPPDSPERLPSERTKKPAATIPGEKSDREVANTPPTGPADIRPLVVAFGDSLSAGFGADPGKSYPDYLQKLIDKSGRNYRVYNAGVSGDTTTDGLERLPGILTLKPKIVILELGGNDGLRGIPPATVESNLDKMIVALQGVGAKVILAGITLPRNYGPDYLKQFDAIYNKLAAEHHLTRVPFLLEGVATDKKLMQADSIHPTADGNKKVADTVFKYLSPLLTERAG